VTSEFDDKADQLPAGQIGVNKRLIRDDGDVLWVVAVVMAKVLVLKEGASVERFLSGQASNKCGLTGSVLAQ
jgi:hypothetical protein